MTERVEFHVDELVVDADLSDAEAERLSPVLEAAFRDLAERLRMAPGGRFRKASRMVLRSLVVDAVSAEELLGSRGAARIADAFWEQLHATARLR